MPETLSSRMLAHSRAVHTRMSKRDTLESSAVSFDDPTWRKLCDNASFRAHGFSMLQQHVMHNTSLAACPRLSNVSVPDNIKQRAASDTPMRPKAGVKRVIGRGRFRMG